MPSHHLTSPMQEEDQMNGNLSKTVIVVEEGQIFAAKRSESEKCTND